MTAIPTRVDPSSEAFDTNASYMRAVVDELKQRLSIVSQGGGEDARRKHTERGKPDEEREQFLSEIRTQYETQGNPYYATARLWDDGVIDPVDTRRVLGQAISAAMCGPEPGEEQYGVFRM